MNRSGWIFGAIALVVILLSSLISPLCAPCVAVFIGLGAGYVAGVFAKPASSQESIRVGGIAGATAGGLGLLGGLVGGVLNSLVVNPATINEIYRNFGIPSVIVNQSQILTYQLLGAGCIGVFDIVFMAILGIAGGALWYQIVGKNQTPTVPPTQGSIPSSI